MLAPARQRLAQKALTGALIHKVMSRLFPKRSDYGSASFEELVPELAKFGITHVGAFQKLVKKHRRELIAIDRDHLAPW